MTAYEARFATDGEVAYVEIEADSPEQALKKAHQLWDEGSAKLSFESCVDWIVMNEITIRDEDGNDVALWMDDDLRLRLAARPLLAALEKALAALNQAPRFRVPGLDMDSYEIAALCDKAIAEAKGGPG
jgi:hypothetical protein